MFRVRQFPEFPYVMGHRGARSYAPENTIAGFEMGLACGANLIECDAHLSKDGHVVLIHDDKLKRTTQPKDQAPESVLKKIKGFVHNLTLEELRSLDAGDGERIPTLDEALQWVSENPALLGFVIDVKTCPKDPRKMAQPVLDVILARKMEEKCMVISFDHTIAGEIKHQCSQIATGLLYCNPNELKADIFELCEEYQANTLWPSVSAVTPELVSIAHEKNLGVFTWVANTEKQMKRMITAGVDGIGSDVPDKLSVLCQRRSA
jgi:glycerophosphoryl diester phosphodiesterase